MQFLYIASSDESKKTIFDARQHWKDAFSHIAYGIRDGLDNVRVVLHKERHESGSPQSVLASRALKARFTGVSPVHACVSAAHDTDVWKFERRRERFTNRP